MDIVMRPSPPVAEPASPTAEIAAPSWRQSLGRPDTRTLLMGLAASVMMLVGGFGAGGVLVRDPILTNSALGFWRYGHGSVLAGTLVYGGVLLMLWAWIRMGRDVLAGRIGDRTVLSTTAVWIGPLLLGPPLFTRDIFSYLAQGALPLAGLDPYAVGPEAMPGILTDNVHSFWQDTPAPYGPLFILMAKGIAALVGEHIIIGVLLMRLALLPGLALLVWALPELTRRMGGRVPVTLWLVIANPVMVILMIGGGHNDLLVIGGLAAGALLALRGRPVAAIVVVTAAMAVKASAGVALPFLVLVWAANLSGTRSQRILKAAAAGIAVSVATFGLITVAARVDLGWLPALSAPSMIVNWMSIPTGVGELAHFLVQFVVTVPKQPFINVARVIGGVALVAIAVREWWAARDGGPEAIRRAGVVLLATAVLSPATLPWYLSWGIALMAAAAWRPRGLQAVVVGSLMLIVVYYPDGEDALYNPVYLIAWLAVAVLAAVSLVRPDPLRLAAGARRPAVTDAGSPPTGDAQAGEPTAAADEPLAVPDTDATPAGAQRRAG